MPFVVTENCIKCKYTDCVEVCPVDCFHEGPNFLVIDPDECIDCTLCEPECPINAIYPEDDVPAGQEGYVALNAELSRAWPVITTRKDPLPDAKEWEGKPDKLPLLARTRAPTAAPCTKKSGRRGSFFRHPGERRDPCCLCRGSRSALAGSRWVPACAGTTANTTISAAAGCPSASLTSSAASSSTVIGKLAGPPQAHGKGAVRRLFVILANAGIHVAFAVAVGRSAHAGSRWIPACVNGTTAAHLSPRRSGLLTRPAWPSAPPAAWLRPATWPAGRADRLPSRRRRLRRPTPGRGSWPPRS